MDPDEPDWDSDDLPSIHDPGVVDEPAPVEDDAPRDEMRD